MAKIVECVPNFSEGRDEKLIKMITDEIEAVEGVVLKDVDPGPDMNRVVVTFFGSPKGVKEAAFRAVRRASELIDMRRHHGTHPRMGATDVCPFVPVNEVTMEECVEIAREVGKRIGEELGIPVYLYENAASSPDRQNLAVVRRGEYEGLPEKLQDPRWRPDFGPAAFNPGAGATAVGAREFLIAYNIDLNSRNKDHATDIAFELREKGRTARRGNTKPFYYMGELLTHKEGEFYCGSCDFVGKTPEDLFLHSRDAHRIDYRNLALVHGLDPDNLVGQSAKKPGIYPHCKAIGWEVPEFDRVQISINLTNYKITPPHVVLEKARELAMERGIVITGSEIVGLVPLQAMLDAGRFYLNRMNRCTGIPQRDILNTAIQSMGLCDVAPFDVKEKVIGYTEPKPKALISKVTHEFVHEVSRDSPAPGGGSVAALSGALGAALGSMVANLTVGKPGYEAVEGPMLEAAEKAQEMKEKLLEGVDADTEAFNAYIDAIRMPKGTPAECEARGKAMQDGLKQAVAIPLETAKNSLESLKACRGVAESGNKNSVSDAGVGAHMAFAGLQGAILNVLINLGSIKEDAYISEMKETCRGLDREARAVLDEAMRQVNNRMDHTL